MTALPSTNGRSARALRFRLPDHLKTRNRILEEAEIACPVPARAKLQRRLATPAVMFVGSTDAASEFERVDLVVPVLCPKFTVALSIRKVQNRTVNIGLVAASIGLPENHDMRTGRQILPIAPLAAWRNTSRGCG